MNRVLMVLGVLLALSGLSCESGPVAGELTFNLTTPNADDGAVQLAVAAVAPNTLTSIAASCSGCKVFATKVGENQYRAVVTGTIGAGALVRVGVSDVNNSANYSAQVSAVASRTFVLRATGGYTLAVAP